MKNSQDFKKQIYFYLLKSVKLFERNYGIQFDFKLGDVVVKSGFFPFDEVLNHAF